MSAARHDRRGAVRERIEGLCAQGLDVESIIKRVGCNPEYAHQVVRIFRAAPGRNDTIKADHEGHIAAVMAEGGFLSWSEQCIGTDRQGRRKMVVCLPLRRAA